MKEKNLTINQESQERDIEATPNANVSLGTIKMVDKSEQEFAKKSTENILQRQKEINEQIANLPEAEKDLVLAELCKQYGIEGQAYEKFKEQVQEISDNPKLPVSDIFSSLGWLPISEMLQRVSFSFKFGEIIPFKIIRNGLHRIFYRDFRKVDHLSAYKQSDYQFDPIHNPKGGITVEEIWKVYNNIHMGFTMWSPALNQNTRDIALFIAIFNEFEWNVINPIAVEFYRMRLRLIATGIDYNKYPLDEVNGTPKGVNWNLLPTDIEIEGTDEYDALTQLFTFLDGLNQPSRSNLPARYNPVGLENNAMTQFDLDNYVLVCSPSFKNYLNVQLKSGRFHEKYLSAKTPILPIDFAKSFGEFNGDTGFNVDFTNCDLRLVPKATNSDGAWIIGQYEGLRSQPNLNLTEIVHYWTLTGVAVHRLTPIFNIKFKVVKKEKPEEGIKL